MGHPTMQENDTAKLTPTTMMIKPLNLKMKSGTICMLCVWL